MLKKIKWYPPSVPNPGLMVIYGLDPTQAQAFC